MQYKTIPLDKETNVLLIKSKKTEKFISKLEKLCKLSIGEEQPINSKPRGNIAAMYSADIVIDSNAMVIKNRITGEFFKVEEISDGKLNEKNSSLLNKIISIPKKIFNNSKQ